MGLLVASIIFLAPLLLLADVAALPTAVQGSNSRAGLAAWQPVGLRGERVLALSVASSGDERLLYAETHTGWWRYGQADGWRRLDLALPHTILGGPALAAWRVVPGRGRQLYALTGSGTARQLYRSDDGGDSWLMIGPAPGQTARPAMIVFPGPAGTPDTITVATDTRLQRSTDGGATWAPGGAWPRPQPVYTLLGDSQRSPSGGSTSERLYALGEYGDFWLSESGGLAWHTPPLREEKVTALAVASYFGVRIWAALTDRLASSTDGGNTWTMLPLPTSSARIFYLLVDPRVPDTLYASLTDGTVYRSDDAGISWSSLGRPGPARAGALALDPDTRGQLYAATEDGVWVRSVTAPLPTALPVEAVNLPPTEQPATLEAMSTGTAGLGGASATPGASAIASPTGTVTSPPTNPPSGIYDTATATRNGPFIGVSPSPSPRDVLSGGTRTPTPAATPSATPTNSPTQRPSRTPTPTRPAATPTATATREVVPPTAAPREPAPTARPPTAPPPTATSAPPTAPPPTATVAPPTATPPFFTPEPR